MTKPNEGRQRIERLEGLIHEVESFSDPAVREHTRGIVQALMELHAAGLDRMLEKIADTGPSGLTLIDDLAADDLVGSLFLLYDLHPQDVQTRVRLALEKARPILQAHGGSVELLGVEDGVVRVRIAGSSGEFAAQTLTLRSAIEEAIYEKAPDVSAIDIECQRQASAIRMALPMTAS